MILNSIEICTKLSIIRQMQIEKQQTNTQQQPVQTKQQPKGNRIAHFNYYIDLAENVKIEPYISQHTKKEKGNKKKLEKFTYYKLKDGRVMKVLYRNHESYVNQGYYPFTDPICKIQQVSKDLDPFQPQRLTISEAAYIGHTKEGIIVKKMKDVNLQEGKIQIQTKDDNFEILQVGNVKRFMQFMHIMRVNPQANQMAIRVMIDESIQDKPRICDFQFFFREAQLKKNKNFFE